MLDFGLVNYFGKLCKISFGWVVNFEKLLILIIDLMDLVGDLIFVLLNVVE